mmetsp:Transcript_29473/g.70990  ORF Transcript_29473/g.70990 Transcript_29473/m.70990 type:complete len:209 (-) Transcript_29473:1135-1761(-)
MGVMLLHDKLRNLRFQHAFPQLLVIIPFDQEAGSLIIDQVGRCLTEAELVRLWLHSSRGKNPPDDSPGQFRWNRCPIAELQVLEKGKLDIRGLIRYPPPLPVHPPEYASCLVLLELVCWPCLPVDKRAVEKLAVELGEACVGLDLDEQVHFFPYFCLVKLRLNRVDLRQILAVDALRVLARMDHHGELPLWPTSRCPSPQEQSLCLGG